MYQEVDHFTMCYLHCLLITVIIEIAPRICFQVLFFIFQPVRDGIYPYSDTYNRLKYILNVLFRGDHSIIF